MLQSIQPVIRRLGAMAAASAFAALAFTAPAHAANSEGCEGGGFRIVGLLAGRTVTTGEVSVPAAQIPATFRVVGRYVEFTVVANTFGVRDYLFTGAPNALDMTGGRRIVVWSERTPDHRGLTLGGAMSVEIDGDDIEISRAGQRLSMKITAKDCAQGGIYQAEPERGDGTTTRFTHVLAPGMFYYDNPNFRAREGDSVPFKDTFVTVSARVNIGTDVSRRFIARDSAQVAERVNEPTCANNIPTRNGATAVVQHCGRVTRWDVASGGRMGFVTGEDAHEVAPPPTDCTHQCQAQNRVRGRSTKLGFPFPVPANVRLRPDFFTGS